MIEQSRKCVFKCSSEVRLGGGERKCMGSSSNTCLMHVSQFYALAVSCVITSIGETRVKGEIRETKQRNEK